MVAPCAPDGPPNVQYPWHMPDRSATRPRVLAGLIAAMVVALGAVVTAAVGGVVTDAGLLPDLHQLPPYGISARRAPHGRVVLTFASAVGNGGQGPLILNGTRDRRRTVMTINQEIVQTDGTRVRIPIAGGMRYTPFGHNHWHFLQFDAFELRDPVRGVLVSEGHKVGFCLGSRFTMEPPVPGAPAVPAINTNCGRFLPGLTRMRMGIDVGYADDYAAYLEFQYIDITHVPAGRYVVVHRADPQKRLVVGDRSDDVASTLIEIGATAGRGKVPSVTTLAECAATSGAPDQPCVATAGP